ncbi:MAG TPA: ABC transporter permease, partial [Verrucomicrobiae bacterium]|nr:ABC transporter permease [Verrucomicrobiae bacterium]
FGLSFFIYGLPLAGFLFVLFLFGISLGIVGIAIVLRLGPASEWFIWPIPAVVAPFVGVFYPISTLPAWMQWISRILPPSYVFEGLRAIVNGQKLASSSLLLGSALAFVDLFLACWIFTRVYRYAVRTGLLARYSAESVG